MKKIFLTVLLAMITVLSVFGLSSCDEECTHEWGEWSISSPSTCSAQGTKQRKCSKCEEIQSENIDIADHQYDVENIVWTWNCYESATATLSCITDSTHTRQINANVTDEVTTAPTCTATGTKTYTATVKIDGVTYTATKNETIAALGHTEVTDAAVAATCEKTGLTEGSHCSVCKEVLVAQQETPKAAHTETKIEAVAATCSTEGATEGVKCSVCGEILVAPQPTSKVAHTEETIPAVAATCSENGLTEGKKCSICDEVLVAQQPTNKLPHTETALLGVAPSCSEEGLTEGKKCSVCGTVTVEQEPIDKLPHTEETVVGTAPTCSTTGLSDGKKCSVCKETLVAQTILPKVACDYESVITAPTCEAQGYTTHTCSMCKDSLVDTYVEELGHNWGAWEVSGSYTLRNCTNDCECGKYQRINSINATYNGIRLLTGESVWKNDVTVTAMLSDNTTIDISDFTLENDVMTVDGSNYVDVKFHTMSTKIAVPAIYDNLPGATSDIEFTYTTSNDAVTITGFVGTSTKIVIPSYIYVENNRVPVRCIDTYAFAGTRIEELTIPNSVKAINSGSWMNGKNGAFENCKYLTKVTIGDNVDAITNETFEGCSSLETVIIGNRVQTIGARAFSGCSALKNVTIGTGVETIGEAAFANCGELVAIEIPSNVKTIQSEAFVGCNYLTTLTLNEGLQTIGSYAFAGTRIEELTIPNTVKAINSGSWTNGKNGAFENCKYLTKVTIGNNVESIGNETFEGCTSLKTVVIGNRVQTIGTRAFSGCSALNDVTIGTGVITINDYAFENCTALTSIVIPDNVQNIGEYAFKGCVLLVNFNIGIGVQRIGAYALQDCISLKSVAIPANVQVIGAGLFTNCSSLEEVIIEKGVLREVGNDVFNGCSNFDRMYYTGTASDWVLVAVSEDNSYPLNVSPYYYSSSSPSGKGNYWYYNGNGEIRVWNVSETSFKAEEYSEKFANSTFGSSNTSYSSQFLSQLEGDSLFQARILIWEGLHLATGSVWENKLISKKDVYKMVIYDLVTGKANSQASPIDGIEEACDSYVYEYAKFLLGSDSITKAELEQLSTLDCDYIEMVDKYFEGIDVLKEVFEMSLNLYDALYVCAQYQAFVDLDENFRLVLTEMANDSSLPRDLRNAARESIEYYDMATESMLQMIALREFTESTLKVCVDHLFEEAWKNLLGSVFPQVELVTLTAKGVMFLADAGFNLDACNEAYYQLEAAVGLENALRNVIKNTLPDYLRYNYKDKSEYYMYAIDMYQTSVILGFDYSNNLLREHSKSADVNAEEKQAYENMMAQISGMKQEKETMYNNFESVIEQLYVAYYS